MATVEIYCECKHNELGTTKVQGDFWPYVVFGWIHDKHPKAKCKHCGEILKVKK